MVLYMIGFRGRLPLGILGLQYIRNGSELALLEGKALEGL
jgi:hypothetical protein